MHVVWQTWHEPIGAAVALNEDPDGDGTAVTMNIRMPGQYFDAETGLHYNWHRYYDPAVGRYVQAEVPHHDQSVINPFIYTGNNPLNWADKSGWRVQPGYDCVTFLKAGNPDSFWALFPLLSDPTLDAYACSWDCPKGLTVTVCDDIYPNNRPDPAASALRLPDGSCELNLSRDFFRERTNLDEVERSCLIMHEQCHLSKYTREDTECWADAVQAGCLTSRVEVFQERLAKCLIGGPPGPPCVR